MKRVKHAATTDAAAAEVDDTELPRRPVGSVAIVGRPNVGKSALFNRLAGRKISIVHDQPGITRDRLVAPSDARYGAPFEIIDTGGIGQEVDGSFSARVQLEAEIALAAADVILLVVDGRAGITPVDQTLVQRLRRADKPVLLIVNKIDEEMHTPLEAEFARLGFAEVYGVSAAHGRGLRELVGAIADHLGKLAETDAAPAEPVIAHDGVGEDDSAAPREAERRAPRLALVGRPNVGKSSLTNAILGQERTIVSDIAGTTRDAVDVECVFQGKPYVLIDTAGIRHRGKRDNSAEIFSVMRSEESIRRADLCILVIDASAGVTAQDRQIAGLIQKANKPCVVAVNKWDLLEPPEDTRAGVRAFREEWLQEAQAQLFFMAHVPLIALSALHGAQVGRLFTLIEKVRRAALETIGTGPLNRLLHAAMELQPPPLRSNKRFKLLYATQLGEKRNAPIPIPAFLLFVNDPALLVDTYRKYLENKIRETFPLPGLPIFFKLRGREQKEADS
jgi:GTP-binding protein